MDALLNISVIPGHVLENNLFFIASPLIDFFAGLKALLSLY
jgi:hypothetical protein